MVANDGANGRDQSVLDRLDVTQRYLATEFAEGYEDGLLQRRDLVERILRMTGGAGSAAIAGAASVAIPSAMGK